VSFWQPVQWHAIEIAGGSVMRIFTRPHRHDAAQGSFQSLIVNRPKQALGPVDRRFLAHGTKTGAEP
jgi:hypothetical protein